MSKMLCHSDGVSATTVLDNGTIVYWTAGGSEIYFKEDEDTLMLTRIDANTNTDHPILSTPEIAKGLVDEIRPMTPDEEWEWDCKKIKRPKKRR